MKGTVHSATPPTGASLPTRWLGRARWAGGRELLLNRWWSAVRPSDRSCATGWDQVWARARFGTQGPTLASLELLHRLGAERGLDVAEWLCSDAEDPARSLPSRLEAGHPRAGLRSSPCAVSVAAFNRHVDPMERARGTRAKYCTNWLSVLTWAIWKGVWRTATHHVLYRRWRGEAPSGLQGT